MSLQLDMVLPTANAKAVVTDDQIQNLIMNLPKDLPEAFERALEGIVDKSYQDKILKLVMAAEHPLTIDQLRVALAIVPGDPVWHPERLPRDGAQLISLCGGNLLELDDEEGKVRFIHHSAIQHLLSPSTNNPTTSLYHFSLEDSHNLAGSVCVTFLNLESRIVWAKRLEGNDVAEKVKSITKEPNPVISRLIHHMRSTKRTRTGSYELDIGRLALETRASQTNLDLECFRTYALENWLSHTRFFNRRNEEAQVCWNLWWRLLRGNTEHVSPSFPGTLSPTENSMPVLLWAIENEHSALFLEILTQPGRTVRPSIHEMFDLIGKLFERQTIRGEWLGDIVAQLLDTSAGSPAALASWVEAGVSLSEQVKLLVGLDASLTKCHHREDMPPLEILLRQMGSRKEPVLPDKRTFHAYVHKAVSQERVQILHTLLSSSMVKPSLQSDWVPSAMRGLIRTENENGLRAILAYHPSLQTKSHDDSLFGTALASGNVQITRVLLSAKVSTAVSSTQQMSAMRRALGRQQKDMAVLLLDIYPDLVDVPTHNSTSLLSTAIEKMSDDWVYLLLNAGADPRLDQSKCRSEGDNPVVLLTPLQAAFRQNRTRVCLELIYRGATVKPTTGPSPADIAASNKNQILMLKLSELEFEGSSSWGPTALGMACQMFALRTSENTQKSLPSCFGSWRTSASDPDQAALNWMAEVERIVQCLARDADAKYLDVQDTEGNTALHYLAATGLRKVSSLVQLLLSKGANPRIRNQNGEMPVFDIFGTYFQHHMEPHGTSFRRVMPGTMADLLTAPLDAQDHEGYTILHYLVMYKAPTYLIEAALEIGANPNIPNWYNVTPATLRRSLEAAPPST